MNDELLYRYLTGFTSKNENQEIKDWLAADPKQHMAQLNGLRLLCAVADQCLSPDATPRKVTCRWTLRRLGRYAAVAATSVAILFGVWYASDWNTYRQMSDKIVRLEAPMGQQLKLRLEDGTDVQLNAGTVLEYPPIFGRSIRRVKLSGEAMFEVQHDGQRPFIVETFTSEVEVLGTKFNVLANEDHNRFRATLIEGSVKVTNLLDPSETVVMEPYDVVELLGHKLNKTKTRDFRDLCWTEGLIHIKNMPFDDLMNYFEKVYNVRIVISRDALPKIELQSGKVRISDGVEYALHVLQQISDFSYTYDENNNLIEIK